MKKDCIHTFAVSGELCTVYRSHYTAVFRPEEVHRTYYWKENVGVEFPFNVTTKHIALISRQIFGGFM